MLVLLAIGIPLPGVVTVNLLPAKRIYTTPSAPVRAWFEDGST